jgi:hypothetical protein
MNNNVIQKQKTFEEQWSEFKADISSMIHDSFRKSGFSEEEIKEIYARVERKKILEKQQDNHYA